MKDQNLESFVRKNRSSFDVKEPRPELWYEIDQKIRKKKPPRLFSMNIMGIAASVVLLIGIGIGIGMFSQINNSDKQFYAQSQEINEFPEVEKHFIRQINQKTSELKSLGTEDSVEENLAQLDEVYEELKNEFLSADGKNKELIIDAMIENYQTKIEILELILGKSKQAIEQEKTMDDETINI